MFFRIFLLIVTFAKLKLIFFNKKKLSIYFRILIIFFNLIKKSNCIRLSYRLYINSTSKCTSIYVFRFFTDYNICKTKIFFIEKKLSPLFHGILIKKQ